MGHAQITATDERILAARQSLTERVAALEDRVTNTVEQATGTVDHATAAIRGTVEDATKNIRSLFDTTGENVRGVLDIRRQVRDNPWQGLLLAVGAGLATRWLTNQKSITPRSTIAATDPRPTTASPFEELFAIVRRELIGLGETAVESVSQKLKENISAMTATPVGESMPRRESIANGYYQRNGVH